jgi:hypothetical protein
VATLRSHKLEEKCVIASPRVLVWRRRPERGHR